jgi:hypothetical protein
MTNVVSDMVLSFQALLFKKERDFHYKHAARVSQFRCSADSRESLIRKELRAALTKGPVHVYSLSRQHPFIVKRDDGAKRNFKLPPRSRNALSGVGMFPADHDFEDDGRVAHVALLELNLKIGKAAPTSKTELLAHRANTFLSGKRITVQDKGRMLPEGPHDAVHVMIVFSAQVLLDKLKAEVYLLLAQGCGH